MNTFEFTETNFESGPFRGVINFKGKEVPFLIESIFNIWFNFKNTDLDLNYKLFDETRDRRVKKFDGEFYVDALIAMDLLPFEFILDIKNKYFEKLFESVGVHCGQNLRQ